MSFLSHRIDRRHPTYPRTLCMGSDRCHREERAALRPHAHAAERAVLLKRTGSGAIPDRLTKAFAIYFTITFTLGLVLAVVLLIAYA
jgi:hypothetical protein